MYPRHPTVEFGTLNSDDGAETLDLISSPEGDMSGFNVHQLTINRTTGIAGGFDVEVRYRGSNDFVTPTPPLPTRQP